MWNNLLFLVQGKKGKAKISLIRDPVIVPLLVDHPDFAGRFGSSNSKGHHPFAKAFVSINQS